MNTQNDLRTSSFEVPIHPFLEHVLLSPIEISEGEARMEFVVRDLHLRHGGAIHGGVYATVMDSITALAAQSSLPVGHSMVTIQLQLNMTGAARAGDKLIATGQMQHAGRTTAVCAGQIRRDDGKLLATGSATLMYLADKPPRDVPVE